MHRDIEVGVFPVTGRKQCLHCSGALAAADTWGANAAPGEGGGRTGILRGPPETLGALKLPRITHLKNFKTPFYFLQSQILFRIAPSRAVVAGRGPGKLKQILPKRLHHCGAGGRLRLTTRPPPTLSTTPAGAQLCARNGHNFGDRRAGAANTFIVAPKLDSTARTAAARARAAPAEFHLYVSFGVSLQ
ncbi:hypothetical protein EVAR_103446_1 [Eumeta japonica]|uniref:Uncharacterized protein n=1 Tax=Eumeta variegata TaxID=151549 RepID=A0A4C1Z500_EUMVA|nr:hypothetical protein EVAR_103446_1 [Eumeta japonica]